MNIVFSPEALDDLFEIADWIAADNPARAMSFVDELQDRCFGLAAQSRRFPVVCETWRGPLHKMTHAGYLVFYLVGRSVEIVRVVHGSRDWAAIVGRIE